MKNFGHIKFIATTLFTLKLIFTWSWFETIYTLFLLLSRRLLASIFNKTWLKWDLVFDGAVVFLHYKMLILDSITNENNKNWPFISDHPYRILIIGGSKSGKINALINLINEQNDIGKIYLYAKDLSEHEILIKQRKKALTECSNTMDDVYGNIDDYNSSRKRKILIVFDDMISDIMTNKKFHAKIE